MCAMPVRVSSYEYGFALKPYASASVACISVSICPLVVIPVFSALFFPAWSRLCTKRDSPRLFRQ